MDIESDAHHDEVIGWFIETYHDSSVEHLNKFAHLFDKYIDAGLSLHRARAFAAAEVLDPQ